MSLTNRQSLPHTLGIAEMSQSDRYVLEVFGEAVGVLVMEESSFVFYAAKPEAFAPERHLLPRHLQDPRSGPSLQDRSLTTSFQDALKFPLQNPSGMFKTGRLQSVVRLARWR